MTEKEDDCYYSCFGCGTIMKLEGTTLTCPVCGHTVDVEHYYDEIENTQNMFSSFDKGEEDDPEEMDFNSFYTY